MNRRDYFEWWNYHVSCLTSVNAWFEKHPESEKVHTAWAKALDGVTLADACTATDAIVAGDIDRPFPEETPAVIRRFASSLAAGRRNYEPEPDQDARSCGLCRGTGHVTIWHPLAVRAVRERVTSFQSASGAIYGAVNDQGDPKRQKCAIACKCELGAKYAWWMRKEADRWVKHPMPRYGDSVNHVPVVFRTHEENRATTRELIQADMDARQSIAVEWEF